MTVPRRSFNVPHATSLRTAACTVLLLAAAAPAARPQGTPNPVADSAADARTAAILRSSDAWFAIGFIAGTAALAPLDIRLAGTLRDSSLQANRVLRSLAGTARFMGFPGSAIIGTSLYAAGRLADMPHVAAIGLHGTEAIALSWAMVWSAKNLVGRARPDEDPDDPFDFALGRGFRRGDAFQSFPSGHTAAAFAAAAAVTAETSIIWPRATPYVAPVLYTGALAVGVSRVYHNRHWASDAIAGAVIGTFSGLAVIRYHYGRPDNPIDRRLLPTALIVDGDRILLAWVLPGR